nr:Chain M, GLY-ARG-LEU-GLY-PHE-TYR-GLY-TYR-ASP-LEU-GLN-ASP [Methanocaldococcus jannaschii]6PEU_N Chain N, GLY-ARG-LEU-GLY-PHE-TYR-GLY-TYR-ASP-LEU-GLN-ASP [Methanocaldococcus jannaschii]6PEU_P Chain P, GLY-ARG-LEU-GLY-PHE-TYR-GLY-TYR-ASP-LEU-GLN-ASP [Methanocaldococcus jannaschii]6PEU_Q Chain Q, GLY-ARG-LEU-GLY-PHE-TYR-GLY-TYR-ASP-LEU-GLN-ASP [Methanocaldococcus jannaschii]
GRLGFYGYDLQD